MPFDVLWVRCVSFFFSSRRRHTRYIGDWSSDVCSSDLIRRGDGLGGSALHPLHVRDHGEAEGHPAHDRRLPRSEDRRVGKECRSRWWTEHEKKKKECQITTE